MDTIKTEGMSAASMRTLSRLLLESRTRDGVFAQSGEEVIADACNMSPLEFESLTQIASSNHVIIRGLEVLLSLVEAGHDEMRAGWASRELAVERKRIALAVPVLHQVCQEFENSGIGIAVIKSLDHWPDLGSDLDLYTDAEPHQVLTLMKDRFGASLGARSWGDRLAQKWNFLIPGLSESVEIHVGRLGQTGEQASIASGILAGARHIGIDGMEFPVSSIPDRIMISTLQRMYRHFYFRLCDVIDTTEIADSHQIDYRDLQAMAIRCGIWEGVATYLLIVSDYAKSFRGFGLDLPAFVVSAARFGGGQVHYGKEFLRVNLMPHSAGLYRTQLAGMFHRHQFTNGARLSLLPGLAISALVGQKLSGSDKGIW